LIASWLRTLREDRVDAGRDDAEQVSILIADGDQDLLALLSTIVERRVENVQVRTAGDGVDALEQIAAEPPAILLVGIDMPRLSGVELCMHLAGMPEAGGILLCAISGRANPADRSLLAQLGVGRVIDMTEPPNRIIAAIERLVANARARRVAPYSC
jgi:CheY-like chemotaxis protein